MPGKDSVGRGWTHPAQGHHSAPVPVLWGLQSSALLGKLRLRWVSAQDPSVIAAWHRCAPRSALGKATCRSIGSGASPALPCPGVVFGSLWLLSHARTACHLALPGPRIFFGRIQELVCSHTV